MSFPTATLEMAVRLRIPVIVWGPPGIGKTARISQLANRLGLPLTTLIASIREPSDFGFPRVSDDGVLELCPPSWVKKLQAQGNAILFLDELSTVPRAVQAPLLRIIQEKVVGDEQLPNGVAVVAAANPPAQAAGGWLLAPPLANRLLHLEATADVDEWAQWAIMQSEMHALVAAFLKTQPELLFKMPEDPHKASMAWPSPRSWDSGAHVAAGFRDKEEQILAFTAAVGEVAALTFGEWYDARDIPDPETLLANPDDFTPPMRMDRQYAVLTSVAAAVLRNKTRPRWFAAWKILAKAATTASPDVAAVAAGALINNRGDMPLPRKEMEKFAPLVEAAEQSAKRQAKVA